MSDYMLCTLPELYANREEPLNRLIATTCMNWVSKNPDEQNSQVWMETCFDDKQSMPNFFVAAVMKNQTTDMIKISVEAMWYGSLVLAVHPQEFPIAIIDRKIYDPNLPASMVRQLWQEMSVLFLRYTLKAQHYRRKLDAPNRVALVFGGEWDKAWLYQENHGQFFRIS